jgi:hypothetical protein
MKIAIHAGNESPEIVDAIDTVIGGLEKDRQDRVGCQETLTRDTANKCSLELCASIVLLFLDGCSEWYVSVVFLTGQVLITG